MATTFEQAVDIASVEDVERAVKLSHHPDGLVQFSGPGVTSGRDENGKPNGVAVGSWPLTKPVAGPAFTLVIRGIDSFDTTERPSPTDVTFGESELTLVPAPRIFVLEGHYFPPAWRRFIRTGVDGERTINIVHPNGALLGLKVLLPPEQCPLQGFLGVEIYSEPPEMPDPARGFILSGSTGNIRRNEEGEWLGDGVFCIVPRGQMPVRRSLDYRRPNIPSVTRKAPPREPLTSSESPS
jgi:hypothetical protein